MTYAEALEYIKSCDWRGSVPGLERISVLCTLLGNPQNGLRFIHVAGTNGKGSICAFLSYILKEAGYRVGLFTSPYIEVFNERMQVNNRNISDKELAEIVEYIRPFADSMEDQPTEFELNTAIAFEYFKRKNCDIVILEAGMGGELDSTNVINTPELAVFSAIGLDHTQFLGDTVEKITATKAGIIKKGGRVVLYKPEKASVEKIIRKKCEREGAELFISEPKKLKRREDGSFSQHFTYSGLGDFEIPLAGNCQLENAAVVLKALEVLGTAGFHIPWESVARGFSETKWPGRFEKISDAPVVIVDGAHNPQGVSAATQTLRRIYGDRKIIFIFGVLADKDYAQMTADILPAAKAVYAVSPENKRALGAEDLAEYIKKSSPGTAARACGTIKDAVRLALEETQHDDIICALGSLYMVSDIKKAFSGAFARGDGTVEGGRDYGNSKI